MEVYAGVDVGGTNIVCGLVTSSGEVMYQIKRATEVSKGPDAVLEKIAAMIEEAAVGYAEQSGADISVIAAGIGLPGFVDPDEGIARFAGNLGWRNLPAVQRLQARLNLPVYIDNDVRTYVYGEAVYGAGKGYNDVLGITVGTGIASAMVNDGKLFYGFRNMSGELGHIVMEGLTDPCPCGLHGCLETYASASGMVRQAKKGLRSGEASILQSWFPGEQLEELAAADLSRAYDLGDPFAKSIMEKAGTLLGRALSYAVSMVSPELIIVGGGGALAGDRLLSPLKEELYSRILPDYRDHLKVVTALNNDDAGVTGSAMYAKQKHISTTI
ncbi:ROK family protein [Paenibacillus dokdonensis]|uniref:ROK family protein n=1 Tax=Paenibacillus dokdonensis TaxID=2567944 RepID=A0ABU6GG57_9BACL|nr:ROK family protein [Paenibacillus dokdonensis]MEC0238726.1 ROK family protein [Paenibacillus dokdonensis]